MSIPVRRRKPSSASAAPQGAGNSKPVVKPSGEEAAMPPRRGADDMAASMVRETLERLLCEAGEKGLDHHDVIGAVMSWAAEQAYAAGGYPQARFALLDALETVLLLDATKKRDAA